MHITCDADCQLLELEDDDIIEVVLTQYGGGRGEVDGAVRPWWC